MFEWTYNILECAMLTLRFNLFPVSVCWCGFICVENRVHVFVYCFGKFSQSRISVPAAFKKHDNTSKHLHWLNIFNTNWVPTREWTTLDKQKKIRCCLSIYSKQTAISFLSFSSPACFLATWLTVIYFNCLFYPPQMSLAGCVSSVSERRDRILCLTVMLWRFVI